MNKWVVVAAGSIAAVAIAGGAQAQSWCTPGAKLDVIWKGVWYPATAKSAGPDGCLIGYGHLRHQHAHLIVVVDEPEH